MNLRKDHLHHPNLSNYRELVSTCSLTSAPIPDLSAGDDSWCIGYVLCRELFSLCFAGWITHCVKGIAGCHQHLLTNLNHFSIYPINPFALNYNFTVMYLTQRTTLSNGYLGSRNDEERSEMRYVMRIAEFSESSNLWTQIALSGYAWKHTSLSIGSILTRRRARTRSRIMSVKASNPMSL